MTNIQQQRRGPDEAWEYVMHSSFPSGKACRNKNLSKSRELKHGKHNELGVKLSVTHANALVKLDMTQYRGMYIKTVV